MLINKKPLLRPKIDNFFCDILKSSNKIGATTFCEQIVSFNLLKKKVKNKWKVIEFKH